MRASEIVMTLCSIDEHEKKHGLSKGQKSWKTRLENQLRTWHIAWANDEFRKAKKEFLDAINSNGKGLHFQTQFSLRKYAVHNFKRARLKLKRVQIS